jgi:hypothetical protein
MPGEEGSQAGDSSASDGSASEKSGDAGEAAGSGPAVPGTEGEDRRAAIDRRLDETFGTFDAAVRSAHEAVARERAERAAAEGSASAGGAPGEDEGGDGGTATADARAEGGLESVGEGTAAGEGAETGEGTEQVPGQGGGTGAGGTTGSGPREIPGDVPDGRDDDIVARQIREAAMKETDPELRAALWEEYRRYKRGN